MESQGDAFDRAKKEVRQAYSDACGAPGPRNLDFRASSPVYRDEAIEILESAVKGGYNAFHPDLLEHLPEDCQVYIAREGSVCIYVNNVGDCSPYKDMNCDEFDPSGSGWYRIWWD